MTENGSEIFSTFFPKKDESIIRGLLVRILTPIDFTDKSWTAISYLQFLVKVINSL